MQTRLTILFVNHKANNCGVFQFGKRIGSTLEGSTKYDFVYLEVSSGSFGFGLQGKGFNRLIAKVQEEFDEAIIRLHILFAEFGDPEGRGAQTIARTREELVWKKGIRLEVTHHYLTDAELLDFLAKNSINAFFYDQYLGRGISSVTDYALAVGRFLALSTSSMFRHLNRNPSLQIELRSLKELLSIDQRYLDRIASSWCEENLIWDYERIADHVLKAKIRRHLIPLHPVLQKAGRLLARYQPSFKLGWAESGGDKFTAPAVYCESIYSPVNLPDNWSFNRVLDDDCRRVYSSAIAQLFVLAPDVMYRNVPRANIQQAFVLDTVVCLAGKPFEKTILCINSYEDSAAWALCRLGHAIEEIDPMINYDLETFMTEPGTELSSYDIIFATSVLEHVEDDELFCRQISLLLKPGGTAILTCDFKDDYKRGDSVPSEDHRFYTQDDFIQRIMPTLVDCHLPQKPDWSNKPPDFEYQGIPYSFASLVFVKK
jgi:hypothetical protein